MVYNSGRVIYNTITHGNNGAYLRFTYVPEETACYMYIIRPDGTVLYGN